VGSAAPSGTVTFLFTDIEGSTRLWEENLAAMSEALARHDEMLRAAIEAHDGVVFSTGGDGVAAAFQRAPDAVGAALDAQRRLQSESWDPPLLVRMAVHTGDVEERDGDYFGPPLNRCARLMASGHGGQVLCSGVVASIVAGRPEESALRDLGSHRLRDLSEPVHVFQLDHPALRDAFPPLRSLDTYRGNLPIQPTEFVGREAQVLEVAKALDEARVVTLCGVGGVGKTRLAFQAGAHVLPRFPDGVWVVELAGIGADEAVDETVASALGIQPAPGRTLAQSLRDHLGTKTILLILDNCEHLLNPVAAFVDGALRAAPGLTILTTSREGLGVAGERLVTVPSLELPAPDMAVEELVVTESVRLFVGRAEEAHAAFALSEGLAPAVGELCRRLDGIPLAIELAAARVRVMTPKEILGHLDRRFKLLTAGRRAAATRHQTLQSTLDWSHDLLDEPEKVVFRRLSVFAGDFDRSMAEVVVVDDELDPFEVADALFKLVEKSLVVAKPGSEMTRYRLLETIRDYAWERLSDAGEAEELSSRHGAHFLALAEELGPQLCDAREMEARARIEQEIENLRTALRWAVDAGEADMALRLVDALSNAGSLRSPFGTLPFDVTQLAGAADHPQRAVALASAAAALEAQGDHQRAATLTDTALEVANAAPQSEVGDRVRCHVFGNVAMVSHIQQDLVTFTEMARSWLASARRIDDPFEVSQALNLLGSLLVDPAEGLEAIESALAIAREVGSPSRIAYTSLVLGARLSEVDVDRAEAAFAEGLAAARIVRNDWIDTFSGTQLAVLQGRKGDLAAAAATLVDVVERAELKEDRFAIALGLHYLTTVFAEMGDGETATLLAAWSEHHGAPLDYSHPTFAGWAEGLVMMRDRQTESERRDVTDRAAALDAAEIVVLARRRVDELP
jgi:predicted ATPase/class 3 adenylate cyclase